MNNQDLAKFFDEASANSKVREKLTNIGNDYTAITAYAKERGYNFSAPELRMFRESALDLLAARMKKAQSNESELSTGVKEFYALLNLAETDGEVAKRLEEISAQTRAELIAYGKEKGFNFNEQDIKEVTKQILEPSNEISEEDLELVAGGTTVLVGIALASLIASVAVFGIVGGMVLAATDLS